MNVVTITTDGACSYNPGPGGYAAVITEGKTQRTVTGYQTMTTNNQMELLAVIEAVKSIKKPSSILIRTDSQYVIDGASGFQKWMNKKKLPNRALWQELKQVNDKGKHKLYFKKVPGHSGDELNELCDKLAKEQVAIAKHVLLGATQ